MSAAKTTPVLKKPARCITDASVMSSCSNKLQISQAANLQQGGDKGFSRSKPRIHTNPGKRSDAASNQW